MGCITNCIKGFVPMKWDAVLNASSLNTDKRLIETCIKRKKTRNRAESAIANFLAIEEDSNPLIFIRICLVTNVKVIKN